MIPLTMHDIGDMVESIKEQLHPNIYLDLSKYKRVLYKLISDKIHFRYANKDENDLNVDNDEYSAIHELCPNVLWSGGGLVIKSQTEENNEISTCEISGRPLGFKDKFSRKFYGAWITGMDDRNEVVTKLIMSSHRRGETWALATHPSTDKFVTAGDDGSVRLWRSRGKHPLHIRQLEHKIRCVAYKPELLFSGGGGSGAQEDDGMGSFLEEVSLGTGPASERIAVGQSNGCIVILNGFLQVVTPPFRSNGGGDNYAYSTKGPQQALWDIKYSPDGKMLAAGCQDNHLYVWSISNSSSSSLSSRGGGSAKKRSHEVYELLYRVVCNSNSFHVTPVIHVEWGKDPMDTPEEINARRRKGLSDYSFLVTTSQRKEIRYIERERES